MIPFSLVNGHNLYDIYGKEVVYLFDEIEFSHRLKFKQIEWQQQTNTHTHDVVNGQIELDSIALFCCRLNTGYFIVSFLIQQNTKVSLYLPLYSNAKYREFQYLVENLHVGVCGKLYKISLSLNIFF